jgi:hypothetical protein
MRKIAGISLAFVFLVFALRTFGSNTEAEEAGMKAAQAWLELVDSGKFEESWQEGAELFKNAVTKKDWAKTLREVRSPLGKVLKRTLKSKEYTKTLANAPAGEYVVIKYETSLEKMKSAIETATLMLDKDGKWRIIGYLIVPPEKDISVN